MQGQLWAAHITVSNQARSSFTPGYDLTSVLLILLLTAQQPFLP